MTQEFRAYSEAYHRILDFKELLSSYSTYSMFVVPERFLLTLEQFIGFCDKNGKKIYEGDILNFWQTNKTGNKACFRRYSIKPSICGAVYHDLDNADIYQDRPVYHLWENMSPNLDGVWAEVEIIGNIHENPELLEVTNEPQL